MSNKSFGLDKFEMVVNGEFAKPLHRLIMLRVLHAGSFDGEEERTITDESMRSFCCCTQLTLVRELKSLTRKGYLAVSDMADEKESRDYEILLPSVRR